MADPRARPPPGRFNTQPPEGGCRNPFPVPSWPSRFQHTAARRRLRARSSPRCPRARFQHTAARRRLRQPTATAALVGCFNTQPPEGGCPGRKWPAAHLTCFNTQPPEGGCVRAWPPESGPACFNTQPPEGGCHCGPADAADAHGFQHTAARRRLRENQDKWIGAIVFQHTAARRRLLPHGAWCISNPASFNTQPPEGGCPIKSLDMRLYSAFQHTAARRRLRRLCR